MADLTISISFDASGMDKGVKEAKEKAKSLADSLEETAKKIKSIGGLIKDFGGMISSALTGPLVAAGKKALESSKSFNDAFEKINKAVNGALKPLGEALARFLVPAMEMAAYYIERLGKYFENLSPSTQNAIIVILGVVAAIGPLIAAFGSVIGLIASFVSAIGTIIAGGTVSIVIGAIAAAIGLLVAGIGIAIGVIYALYQAWQNGFGPIASYVALIVAAILTAFSPIFGLPVMIGVVAYTIYEMWQRNFGGLQDITIAVWEKIKEYTSIVLTEIESIVNDIAGRIIAWWNENYPLIEQTVKTVSDAIEAYIRNFLDTIKAFWDEHGETIMAVVSTIWTAVKGVINTVVDFLLQYIKLGMQLINGDWSGAWQTFLGIVEFAVSKVVAAWKWLQDQSIRALAALGKYMQDLSVKMMTGFLTAIKNGFVWLVNKFWELPGLLISIVPALYNAGISIAEAIWNGIKSGFGFGEGPGGGITGPPAGPPANTEKIFSFDGIFDGLDGMWDKVQGWGDSLNSLVDSLKDTTRNTDRFNKTLKNTGGRTRDASKNASGNGVTGNRVATVVNDELMKLGWTPNARLSMLGNIGRENAWNMDTIFSGHNDPANKKKNLGIISWQGDRREKMLEYMRGQGLVGKGGKVMQNDESLRAMVRFMNKEMQTGKWGNQSNLVKDEGASLSQVSKSFQKYILYSRKRPYNTPDAEFDVVKNRRWAERAQGLVDSTSQKSLQGDSKTLEQLADMKIYQGAEERVQKLVQLSRELNVDLTVPKDVTTSNQELILKQEVELRNLTELKKKREEVRDSYIELLPLLQQVGKTAEDYQTGTIDQATRSAAQLKAIKEGQAFVNGEYETAKKKLEELTAAATVAKTPLQQFTEEWKKLQVNSGLTEEQFRKLNPTLAKTEAMLKEIAAIELGKKLDAEAKSAIKSIEGMTVGLRQELDKLNGVKANPFVDFIRELGKIKELKIPESGVQKLIDMCVSTNGIDVEKLKQMVRGWLTLLAAFGGFDPGKIDETVNAMGEAAAAQNTLTAAQQQAGFDTVAKDLQGQLDALRGVNKEQTVYQKTLELIEKSYKDMDPAKKKVLLDMAAEIDHQKELNEQYKKFHDFVSESINILINQGFGAMFKNIIDKFKKMLIDMAVAWITSKIFKLINKDWQGGGGGTGSGKGGIAGLFSSILGGLGIGKKDEGSVASLGAGAHQAADAVSSVHTHPSGGSAGGAADAAGSVGGGLFSPVGNVLKGGKPSALAGKLSGIGALATLAGSIIGGRVGGVISMAGTGMSIGAMFGPWGAAIGAAAGAIIGLFMGDPKKKIDKKENLPKLQKGFTDAMQQLNSLLNDRNAIFSDPDGVIATAMDIRGQIASGFGVEFQSKKYKKVAQQQIAAKLIEADALIKQIKDLADVARMAGKVDTRLEAEFATGVFADRAFIRQHADFKRRNGLLSGAFTGRDTLPSMLAPGEMVLNPRQIARVRFNAGFDAFKGAGIPNYASGGFIGAPAASAAPVSSTPQPVTVQIVLNNSGLVESDIQTVLVDGLKRSDVQVELVKAYDKGKTRARS